MERMLTWSSQDRDLGRPAAQEPTLSHLVVAATFGVFAELGTGQFSRLLDIIAEDERSQEWDERRPYEAPE
jgi:hypothetical protein